MLNREREVDLRSRLLHSYKTLFKIGINLNSRSNFASLLFEGEKRLSELMKTSNITILVIDHEEQKFFKLNYEAVKIYE